MINRIRGDFAGIPSTPIAIKRILVGLAGTPSTPVAIQRALELAQRYHAKVTGVTLMDKSGLLDDEAETAGQVIAGRKQLANAENRIEQSVARFYVACDEAGVRQRRIVQETEAPFTKLIELARYHDLMVFGLKSIFENDFLCQDPEGLLVRIVAAGVRPLIAVTDKYRTINRVLIAYSGSMESAKSMKRFVQMRLFPDAQLKIVTCGNSEHKGQQLLEDAADYCRAHGFSVECQVSPDSPKTFLLEEAGRWQADLIVMGNSARSVLMRRAFGGTARKIVRNSKVPLFLAQ